VSRSVLEGDTSDVFGKQLAPILARPPHSAMYCGGSPVTVHRAVKIKV
jgi:hypothetical protein